MWHLTIILEYLILWSLTSHPVAPHLTSWGTSSCGTSPHIMCHLTIILEYLILCSLTSHPVVPHLTSCVPSPHTSHPVSLTSHLTSCGPSPHILWSLTSHPVFPHLTPHILCSLTSRLHPVVPPHPAVEQETVVPLVLKVRQILVARRRREDALEASATTVLVRRLHEDAEVIGCEDVKDHLLDHLRQTTDHLRQTTDHLRQITDHLRQTTDHLRQTTDHLRQTTHWYRPQTT